MIDDHGCHDNHINGIIDLTDGQMKKIVSFPTLIIAITIPYQLLKLNINHETESQPVLSYKKFVELTAHCQNQLNSRQHDSGQVVSDCWNSSLSVSGCGISSSGLLPSLSSEAGIGLHRMLQTSK